MKPVKIKYIEGKSLDITWDNGETDSIALKILREHCPCAFCRGERKNQSEHYIPLFSDDQQSLFKILQQGNYAIKLVWNDGHDDGIYDFSYLKKLSEY